MCQTIYISEVCVDGKIIHERACVNAGHNDHFEIFVNGKWEAKLC